MGAMPPKLDYKTTLGFNREEQKKHRNRLEPKHPESSRRIDAITDRLLESGLLDRCQVLEEFPEIDEGDLCQTHSREYVDSIAATRTADDEELNALQAKFDSVFLCQETWEASTSAAAGCRHLAELVVEEKVPNAFAIVRPPGHHAERGEANGFCIFNNVAQAVEAAYNFGADRILIADLDVHHGQGTQRIFYDDNRVLYFSIHRYENGAFWPHLEESNFDHVGEGAGTGFNVNIPLNELYCDDADYMTILWNVFMPLAVEFDPQLVIVLAGMDSLLGDPLGGMNFTADGLAFWVHTMKSLAKGRLLLLLEGGYNEAVVADGVEACVRVLLGERPRDLKPLGAPKQSTVDSCLGAISHLRSYWSCFDFYKLTPDSWTQHVPAAVFDAPPEEQRINTGAVDQDSLPKPPGRRASVKLGKPLLLFDPTDSRHFDDCLEDDQVEVPQRTARILQKLQDSGLWDQCEVQANTRTATVEELELAHDRPHVKRIEKLATCTKAELKKEAHLLETRSIFLSKDTFDVARRAVGATLECVDRLFKDKAAGIQREAFAVVRPPGHHANTSAPSGFCIFNNVGIAAHYAMKNYGVERILILDWDVHHGNGTQEIFYDDPRVLYVSLHRYDAGHFYPGHDEKGNHSDAGEGEGKGRTLNVPWTGARMGPDEYMTAFFKVLMPTVMAFNPQLVFVSAGFDAALGDPLGEFLIPPRTYAFMSHLLVGLAGGLCVFVLEGGYNLDSISDSANAVVDVLVKRTNSHPVHEDRREFATTRPTVNKNAWKTLRMVLESHSPYWPILAGFKVAVPELMSASGGRTRSSRTTPRSSPRAPQPSRSTPKATPSKSTPKSAKTTPRRPTKQTSPTVDNLTEKLSGLSTKESKK